MGYGDFKDSCKRTAADKLLRDRSVNIARNPRYDGCQKDPASMFFLIKSWWVVQLKMKSGEIKNSDLDDMQLLKEFVFIMLLLILIIIMPWLFL